MNPFLAGPILVWQARERIHDVTEERVELRMRLSTELGGKLKKVQDLESLRVYRSITLEEALDAAADAYLSSRDPGERSRQHVARSA